MELFTKLSFPKSRIAAKESSNFFNDSFWFKSNTLTIKNNKKKVAVCSSVVVAIKLLSCIFN